MASRKSCHWEGNDYIQLGDHHFSFSLYIHEPGWKNGFHEGKQAQNKLYSVLDPVRAQNTSLPEKQSFISTSGDQLLLTAFKKCEDDNSLIIRMVEMNGSDQKIGLQLFTPVKKLVKTNLIEGDEKDTGQSGKDFKLDIGHNSIETYKLINSW